MLNLMALKVICQGLRPHLGREPNDLEVECWIVDRDQYLNNLCAFNCFSDPMLKKVKRATNNWYWVSRGCFEDFELQCKEVRREAQKTCVEKPYIICI